MTNKKLNVANVPNLRFPGFEGEWEVRKLGEVAEFKAGYAYKSEQMLTEKGLYQLIKMSNVYQNELRLDRNPSFWSIINSKEKEFLLKNGDTVLTLTGTVGKKDFGYSIQIKEDNKYLLNQRLVLLREKKDRSTNDFISYVVSNESFLSDFFRKAKGGTGNQTNVGVEDIKKITFFFPSLSEQKKIASFLLLLDERISTQNKIIEELKSLKNTLSKKIFSRQLKFKNNSGSDFSEWKIEKLGNISTITTGISNREDSILDGKYTFFDRSQDIRTSNKYLFDKEAIIVPGEGQEFIPKFYVGKFDLHQRTYAIFDFVNATGKYIYFHILNDNRHLKSHAVGSTVKSLRLPMFQSMPIKVPGIEEQTKIANFLSSIDYKIDIEHNLLKKLEKQKKYLLVNLFI